MKSDYIISLSLTKIGHSFMSMFSVRIKRKRDVQQTLSVSQWR